MVLLKNPLYWIGLHLVGVLITLSIYCLHTIKEKALQMPKGVQRVFTVIFFLLPPLVIPLLPQPRLACPVMVGIAAGSALLVTMIVVRVKAYREFGRDPGLHNKRNLITEGIYSKVRNPKYLSNLLLGAGWALLFRGNCALVCLLIWFFSYTLLIFFEEKGLAEEYGQKYQTYKNQVPYRLIPYLF